MKPYRHPRASLAFSLIELLAVISIMALITTVVSGALGTVSQSTHLTTAAQMVSSHLNQTRTFALSRNGITELRIFTGADTASPVRLQIILTKNDGSVEVLSRTRILPEGITIASTTQHSGFLNLPPQTVPGDQPLAGSFYRSIRFGPRGEPRDATGAALAASNNFFTLVAARDYRDGILPANWISLRIDDRTGAISHFQP